MKKIINLFTVTLAFVTSSCALFNQTTAGGICTCTCEACLSCKVHHHVLTPELQAKLDSMNSLKSDEEAKKKAELDSLLNMDYSLKQYYYDTEVLPYSWDEVEEFDVEIDSITPLFRASNIENGVKFVNKNANTSIKKTGVHLYFTTKDGAPDQMHLVVHFYADDGVNFYKLRLYADNFTFEYTPTNIVRSRDGVFYVENFDNVVDDKSKDFVAALAKCDVANLILVSDGGVSHRLVLKPDQLKQLRTTYQFYRMLGGDFQSTQQPVEQVFE